MSEEKTDELCERTEQKKMLDLAEISLILDSYEDIFSDFDPRSYEQRALSQDFLWEAKRASIDKTTGNIELKLMIPKKKRKTAIENVIKKRFKEHTKKHYQMLKKDEREYLKKGIIFILSGIIIMFLATLILFKNQTTTLGMTFLVVILEPAGWFLFWEGLNTTIFRSKHENDNLKFYEKMLKCEITFTGY